MAQTEAGTTATEKEDKWIYRSSRLSTTACSECKGTQALYLKTHMPTVELPFAGDLKLTKRRRKY